MENVEADHRYQQRMRAIGAEGARFFGSRVKEKRARFGWTQAELAARMTEAGYSMHQTTVAKLEAGSRPTSVEEVRVLADILAVGASDFFIHGLTQEQREQPVLYAARMRAEGASARTSEARAILDFVAKRTQDAASELKEAMRELRGAVEQAKEATDDGEHQEAT